MHSKMKKEKPSVGVELRAGGDPHRSQKPGWSAGGMKHKKKNAYASCFSYGSFAFSFFDLFKVIKMTNFTYDLFKVGKMTNTYDLSKVSKNTKKQPSKEQYLYIIIITFMFKYN